MPPVFLWSTHTDNIKASNKSIAHLTIGLTLEACRMKLDLGNILLVSSTGYPLNSLPEDRALKNLAWLVVDLFDSHHLFNPGMMLVVNSNTSELPLLAA